MNKELGTSRIYPYDDAVTMIVGYAMAMAMAFFPRQRKRHQHDDRERRILGAANRQVETRRAGARF